MINITRPRDKALAQRMLLRQMSTIEKGFAYRVRIKLNEMYKEAADIVEQGVSGGMDALLDQWLPDFYGIFRAEYKRAGILFSGLVFDEVAQLKFTGIPEVKGMGETFWNSFRGFIELNTAMKVVQVNNTTKKWIARKVRKGTEEGKSPGNIAKDLKASGRFNKMRSLRIARTEIHAVSNFATQEAIKSTRLEMEKEWVAFIDDRTRTSHIVMNEKKPIPMNQKFKVGGMPMEYPGDPAGGAKNCINCRCVLLYHGVKNKYQK